MERGLCQCGCGLPTRIPTKTDRQRGHVRGVPIRFLSGHNSRPKLSAETRFWSSVNKTATCWLWTAHTGGNGYGTLSIAAISIYAHRYSYVLHYGSILPGLFVCHHCDVKLCVRPDHLFIGTAADNQWDASRKGRLVHGEGHPRAKLTAAQVQEIWQMRLVERLTYLEIGTRMGVSRSQASNIIRRRNWKHVNPSIDRV